MENGRVCFYCQLETLTDDEQARRDNESSRNGEKWMDPNMLWRYIKEDLVTECEKEV